MAIPPGHEPEPVLHLPDGTCREIAVEEPRKIEPPRVESPFRPAPKREKPMSADERKAWDRMLAPLKQKVILGQICLSQIVRTQRR